MRRTRQRAEVLLALQNTDQHPTAEWIQAEVRKSLPNVSLATVYRQLAVLEEEGHIAVLVTDNGPRRYDASMHAHHHVLCKGCGRIADVPDLIGDRARTEIERWTGFRVTRTRASWVGTCPACRDGHADSSGDAPDLERNEN